MDEVALQQEEQQHTGNAQESDGRHRDRIAFELGVGADHRGEGGDADRHRLHVLVEGDQQRPEKVVPVQREHDHRRGDRRRARERQGDLEEDLESAGAIDDRGFLQLLGKGQEELAEDLD